MARIAGLFGRVEPRAAARAYLLGLLPGTERKNCWRLAEHAGDAGPGPMQRLLRTARWDARTRCATRSAAASSTTSAPTTASWSWTRRAS